MKKIITLIVLFVSAVSFAQLKVTESTNDGEPIGEYKLLGKSYASLIKRDALCYLTYRDEKFTTMDNYKTFIFKYSDLDALYELLTSYDNIEKGTIKNVELEMGDKVALYYGKSFGTKYVELSHTDKAGIEGKMRVLTAKQYKQLFGK